MYKETGNPKATRRVTSTILAGLLSCLLLASCSHSQEEFYGKIVDKKLIPNMMLVDSGGVQVSNVHYSYRFEFESSHGESQLLNVSPSDYKKCSVGDYFYQDVEGEVTCSPDSFR